MKEFEAEVVDFETLVEEEEEEVVNVIAGSIAADLKYKHIDGPVVRIEFVVCIYSRQD